MATNIKVVLWEDGYHVVEDEVEYGVVYDTPFQAYVDLKYIQWLEQTYSPPRI
jgi:hypothetical protein